ncbi:SusD/RagB family nutrient-binding outer membrane lipoprotein [soil metagenome]
MKKILYMIVALAVVAVLQSCDKNFGELEQNQNRPAKVPPGTVLNSVLNDIYLQPWSLEHRQNQFWCCNYNYYGTNEYWSNASFNYQTLKNVLKMEEEAKSSGGGVVNPYSALGKFFRAYYFVQMSYKVGDIPLTEALKGLENIRPVYDNQKQVYLSALNWLEEANSDLATLIANNDRTLAGDFMLGNDLVKWRRVVNSYKLRVLLSLSKKESDADLSIKAKFAAILADPAKYPLMTGSSDNLKYVYNGTTNLYPTNPGNKGFDKNRYNMAATYISLLTTLQDPRVFVVANPSKKKLAEAVPANSFAAFVGASSGESLDDMSTNAQLGAYSYANQKRYYGSFVGPEPAVLIAHWEQCFNIAEGINRGWAPGNAQTYYNLGITSSMAFYGIEEGTVITITESDNDAVVGSYAASLTTYLGQPSVAYAGGATGLTQILQQKYLAFFQNSGSEAYLNFRRTGVPTFLTGPGTGNGGLIPRRWLYPLAEKTNNSANYNSTVTTQFGTTAESLNTDIWIVK